MEKPVPNQDQNNNRTPDEIKNHKEIFNEFRNELLKRDLSNTENYDKAILTLSSASLGFSFTVLKFIVPIETANNIWLLTTGWLLLLISIVASIIAFQLSNRGIKIALKNAEDYYIHNNPEAYNRKNFIEKVNSFFNYLSGGAFIVAITAIVFFVIINVNQEKEIMSKDSEKKNKLTSLRESTNIPKMVKTQDKTVSVKSSSNIPKMQLTPQKRTAPKAPVKPIAPTNKTSDTTNTKK